MAVTSGHVPVALIDGKRGHPMRWPKHIKAKPTLRGLRLVVKDPDRYPPEPSLYSWIQVHPEVSQTIQSVWSVYDPDNHVIQIDGRQLYLDVSGRRATALALRARRRAWRQAVRQPDFALTEEYPRPNRVAIGLMVLMCAAFAGGVLYLTLPGMLRTWHNIPAAPAEAATRTPVLLAGFAFCTFHLVLAGIGAWLVLRLSKHTARRITLNPVGLQAELLNGEMVDQPWSNLKYRNPAALGNRLSFVDGTAFWLPHHCRAKQIIRIVLEEKYPDQIVARRAENRRMVVRIGWYVAGGFVAAGLMGAYLHKYVGAPQTGLESAGLFALEAGLSLMFVLAALLMDGRLKLPSAWRTRLRRLRRARSG